MRQALLGKMGRITMKALMADAKAKGYGLPAINVSNMETMQTLLEAAEEMRSPIILQVSPMQIEYHEISYSLFVDLVNRIGRDMTIPWALHLDHATTKDQCLQAVRAGFDSVMFDGSHGKLEENIRTLRELRTAVGAAITLEGELGAVGGAEATETALDAVMTDPEEAADFVKRTGVDFLAVSIGNAHGFYRGQPKLDFERLEKIADATEIPLVLHGGTGIPAGDLKKAIALGMCKCNFFSEIDRAFLEGLFESPETTGMYMQKQKNARARMKAQVIKKIKECGSEGQA